MPKDDKADAGSSNLAAAAASGAIRPEEQAAYEKLKKHLHLLVERKTKLEREMEAVEDRIYVEEGVYLQDASAGNIAKGFDYYTKSSQNRRRVSLSESDRVFSNSSASIFDEQNQS